MVEGWFIIHISYSMLKAKVVLSDRDVDAWYDSWWRTMGRVLQIIETPPMSWILKTQENPKMKQVR